MAARKITAANIFEAVEIDLWGNEYTLRTLTKSASKRLDEAQAKAAEFDPATADTDDGAEALINVIDVLLEPVEKTTKPAGEVLTALWESDDLGIDWLTALMETLREEAQARRRPTSPRAKNA